MSAIGQQAEGATPPAEAEAPAAPVTEAPSQPDGLDRVFERMDQMASQQQQLAEQFANRFPQQEEEEPEVDYYDDDGGLTEDGARALIGDLVRESVDAQMAPREAARQVEARDDAYEALKEEYPELQDPKVAQPVLDASIRWAVSHNQQGLIERPEFVDVIEWVYRAQKFEEMRSASEVESPRAVVLESASGAGGRQTRQPKEPDWQQRVIDAAAGQTRI